MIGNRRIFHRKIICIAQMDIIRDIRHAPDTFRALSKNNICALGIYIIRNRGHPRKHRKPFDERVFLWQPVSVNHQTYHHFFGGKSIADQNMAHQPGSGSLIVSRNLCLIHPLLYCRQHIFIFLYPKQTVFHRNDGMRTCRIKSGHKFSFFIQSHRKLCLVAVAERMLHPNDRQTHPL